MVAGTSVISAWGPYARPAAATVTFAGLAPAQAPEAGDPDASAVTPALPNILRALGDRDLDATFFVPPAVTQAEPLAATMIANARHELVEGDPQGAADVDDAAFASPDALHQELQVAVARGLRAHAHTVLRFTPGRLERADALAVFVETLELLEGLRDAGRLWLPTLGQAADWLRS